MPKHWDVYRDLPQRPGPPKSDPTFNAYGLINER